MNDGNEPQQDTPAVAHEPYDGPDRRLSPDEWRAHVNQRLDDGALTMRALREELKANTEATKAAKIAADEAKLANTAIKSDTSEVIDLLKSFQGAMKVLDMLGRLAKPMSYIIMLCSAIWGVVVLVKGGGSK